MNLIEGQIGIHVTGKKGLKRRCIIIRCDNCNVLFPRACVLDRRGYKHKFCSQACKNKYIPPVIVQGLRVVRAILSCMTCGASISRTPTRVPASGKIFCSKTCQYKGLSYDSGLLLNGNCTNGESTYRNRALKFYHNRCEWCKEDIIELLDVHHLDHNHANLDINNLMILCVRCHALETRKHVKIENRLPTILTDTGRQAAIKYCLPAVHILN